MGSMDKKRSYGQVTTLEKAAAIGHALLLPGVILWSICTRYFHAETRAKTLSQQINDVALKHIVKLKAPKLQYLLGTTDHVYQTWAQKSNVPVIEEELGENAKLYWLGSKRPDRVILYLHGGAFLIPMLEPSLPFWNYIQEELSKKGRKTGVAILRYTLVPDAVFPVPLKQAVLALQHLLSIGISPQDIQLGGDSAGGNLSLQLISHLLHPIEDVPVVKLDAPLRGSLLISPWVQMDETSRFPSFEGAHDIVGKSTAQYWCQEILATGIAATKCVPYAQPLKAPNDWFQGSDKVVERLLITTGQLDLLRDQAIQFEAAIRKQHPNVKFIIQENGVHDGPFFDFISKKPQISKVTAEILEWYA